MSDVALVTGANRGLGLEVCKQLSAQGCRVILSARNAEKGRMEAERMRESGADVWFHALDLTKTEHFDKIRTFISDQFGHLDILVNNAAIHYDMGNRASSPNWKIVEEAFQTNLFQAWKLSVTLLPLLRKSVHARIVNVSSSAGALTNMSGDTPAYSISKAGLNVLTIKLAHDLAADDILVNSVCPGWVRTDMGGPQAPRSLHEGASSIVWATQLNRGGPSGGFFRDGKPIAW